MKSASVDSRRFTALSIDSELPLFPGKADCTVLAYKAGNPYFPLTLNLFKGRICVPKF